MTVVQLWYAACGAVGVGMQEVTYFEPPSMARVRPWHQLTRLRHSSDLLQTLSVHRIKVRYKQSRLGLLWAILQPLSMMLVFSMMFAFLGSTPSGEVPYAVFAYAALLPWTAFSSGLSSATTALTGHASLVTKVAFPREVLPITYVVAALVDFAIATTALAGLMIWYKVGLALTALWALPSILLLACFLLALGLLLSALQVRYRDMGLAMPVVLQIWMFASPVLYPLDAVRHSLSAPLYFVYLLNPMVGIVDTFRRGVVLHSAPDFEAMTVAALVIAVLLPVSYLYFKFSEQTMADVI